MKRLVQLVAVLSLIFNFQNCSNDEAVDPEWVQLSIDLKMSDLSGGRISGLPEGAQVQISIELGTGVPVLTNQKINLLSFGGSFITEPFELTPGYYKITDFLIVKDAQVLFATPLKGSPLANAVNHPLAYGFYVGKGKLTNVQMEVIDVSQRLPEDFGYVSFHVGIVNTFEVAVFKTDNNMFEITTAEAHILCGTDTVESFKIYARTSRISFVGDAEKTYTLDIIKDGFGRFSRQFIMNDLIQELDNKALKVYLEPAFTMLAYSSDGSYNLFQISLYGLAGSEIEVNWGDGVIQQFNTSPNGEQSHTYAKEGNYFVSVTGDLSEILSFYSFYGQGMIDKINFENLPHLSAISFGLTRGPRIIDLSKNPELHHLNLANIDQLEELILPYHHSISSIRIDGPNELSSAAVDKIIENIYMNSINSTIVNGQFGLAKNWQDYDLELVGPPSQLSLNRLKVLRDSYSWDIQPEF